MGKAQNQGLKALIKSAYYSRGLFTTSEQISCIDPPLPHSHTVRRAFERLELDAVLYVDRAPTAYFKRVKDLIAEDIRKWQTFLWNQHIVPLLVVISDTKIKVYSSQALPTNNNNDIDDNGRLVKVFDKVADVLELDEVLASIETGEIFRKPESFNRKHAVDCCLLENLTDTAKKLVHCPDKPFTAEFAHLFLTRLLFTCYLIERKMIKGEHFADDPVLCNIGDKYKLLKDMLNDLPPARAINALFRLFGYLKVHFNGSLLDSDLKEEEKGVTDKHIDVIRSFLNGDLKNGQYTLSFWAYDFSAIPIETISSIYQGFISEQGKLQETSGAYYTPPHLAELTVDILLDGYKKPLYGSKVLDPACGSGVFLVSMFNRMANQWMSSNGNRHLKTRAKELLNILENHLFGVDVNITACHITCFSLYLAVLEQLEPCDVEEIKKQGLKFPALLSTQNETKPIVHDNFFNPNLKLASKEFDFVIGNPPWVSRENSTDECFLKYIQGNEAIMAPQKQIAHGFLWKAPEHLNAEGHACLLVPSAVLLNKTTNDFQRKWFKNYNVSRIVNFSDLSFFLFADAIRPACAIRFNKVCPKPDNAVIRYESPKVDIHNQQGGPIFLYDEDVKTIHLSELLSKAQSKEAATVWKTRFWGTWRDSKLLQRLSDMPQLIDITGTPKNNKRFIKGQGLQPYSETDAERERTIYKPWWDNSIKYIDSDNPDLNLIITPKDCVDVPANFAKLRMSPNRHLFEWPKVLISQGSKDMKVAFVDFPVLFRHSLQSIAGEKDGDLLRFLSVVLKSDIIQYYLFHTSANWGTERDKVLLYELLRIPFTPPESTIDSDTSSKIVVEVSDLVKNISKDIQKGKYYGGGRHDAIEKLMEKLETSVCQYYDIDEFEKILVDDTIKIIKPSSTPGSSREDVPTLKVVGKQQRQIYTETLCRMLNIHAKEGRRVEGHIVKADSQSVVVISRANGKPKPYYETSTSQEMGQVLGRIAKLLPAKKGGFVYYRNLKIFDKDHIYIVKPMTLRSWMRSTALNDADEIASAVLRAGEGR